MFSIVLNYDNSRITVLYFGRTIMELIYFKALSFYQFTFTFLIQAVNTAW